jgi:hypothetical protein
MTEADKLTGGLDHTDAGLTGWVKDLFAYMDRDGWLKGVLWTLLGGAFFIALILGTVAFLVSDRSAAALTGYLAFVAGCLKLKQWDEQK